MKIDSFIKQKQLIHLAEFLTILFIDNKKNPTKLKYPQEHKKHPLKLKSKR